MRLSSAFPWVRPPGNQGNLYQTPVQQIPRGMGSDLEVKNWTMPLTPWDILLTIDENSIHRF
jgi:hypothetical protein